MSNDVKGGWTPGPWTVELVGSTRPTHYIGSVRQDGKVDEVTCTIEYDLSYKPEVGARRASNARLIAAAPELFEALQSVIASASPNEAEHPTMFKAWQQARAAIAKATGGTPTP